MNWKSSRHDKLLCLLESPLSELEIYIYIVNCFISHNIHRQKTLNLKNSTGLHLYRYRYFIWHRSYSSGHRLKYIDTHNTVCLWEPRLMDLIIRLMVRIIDYGRLWNKVVHFLSINQFSLLICISLSRCFT